MGSEVCGFVFLIPQRRCFHKSALCIDDLKLFKSMKKTHKLARFRPCYAITACIQSLKQQKHLNASRRSYKHAIDTNK